MLKRLTKSDLMFLKNESLRKFASNFIKEENIKPNPIPSQPLILSQFEKPIFSQEMIFSQPILKNESQTIFEHHNLSGKFGQILNENQQESQQEISKKLKEEFSQESVFGTRKLT